MSRDKKADKLHDEIMNKKISKREEIKHEIIAVMILSGLKSKHSSLDEVAEMILNRLEVE